MKAHNQIDDMFQQHFAETTISMNNQEALWQRIAAKKDDNNRGFFWLGVLGLSFCVIAGFTFINHNNQSNKNLLINNTTTLGYTPQNNSTNDQALVVEVEEDHKNEEMDSKIEVASSPTSKTIKNNNSGNSNSVIVVTKEVENKLLIGESLIDDKAVLTDLLENKLIESPGEIELHTERTPSGEAYSVQPSAEAFGVGLGSSRSAIIQDYKLLNIGESGVVLSNNIPPAFNQSDSWSKCEVKTPGHFFVDVYGQGGLPMDKIDFSQAGSDQTAYRDLWDARFDPAASWHGGAQIGYEFRNGLRVSAGAEYQELVTEYSDNQRITETIRVWDPQAFFTIDMNGDRVWQGDTVTAINIYDRKFVRKNTHTLFHIPLQLSYDIYKKPGFHIAVDVAAALNLSKTYEGQFIRSDQTLIMIDANNQDNYTSKDIGVSLSAGLHLGYYLNDNWELYASPRFRYNPNSYLLDTETLKITRNMIGLRGGVRYHF